MGGGSTKEAMDEDLEQLSLMQAESRTWSDQEWQEWEEWMDTDEDGYWEEGNLHNQRWTDEEWEEWEEWKNAHGYGGWPYEPDDKQDIDKWTEEEWLVWEGQAYSMEERNEWYKKGWYDPEDDTLSEETWTWTEEEWRIWDGQVYSIDEKDEWYKKGWTDPEEEVHSEKWEEWKGGDEEEPPKKTRRV